MDDRLPWHQRLAIRFHLLYCVWCRRYAAQIQFLRKATKALAVESTEASTPKLSVEAKEQMRKHLEKALRTPQLHPLNLVVRISPLVRLRSVQALGPSGY
jgi:hypothetical protein